jgi:hypothetical protein
MYHGNDESWWFRRMEKDPPSVIDVQTLRKAIGNFWQTRDLDYLLRLVVDYAAVKPDLVTPHPNVMVQWLETDTIFFTSFCCVSDLLFWNTCRPLFIYLNIKIIYASFGKRLRCNSQTKSGCNTI